jgi:hypothetical protein
LNIQKDVFWSTKIEDLGNYRYIESTSIKPSLSKPVLATGIIPFIYAKHHDTVCLYQGKQMVDSPDVISVHLNADKA